MREVICVLKSQRIRLQRFNWGHGKSAFCPLTPTPKGWEMRLLEQ